MCGAQALSLRLVFRALDRGRFSTRETYERSGPAFFLCNEFMAFLTQADYSVTGANLSSRLVLTTAVAHCAFPGLGRRAD